MGDEPETPRGPPSETGELEFESSVHSEAMEVQRGVKPINDRNPGGVGGWCKADR